MTAAYVERRRAELASYQQNRPTYWRTWRAPGHRTTSAAGDTVHQDRCRVIAREQACTPWRQLDHQPAATVRALAAIDPLLHLCAVCFGTAPALPGARLMSTELARTNDVAGMALPQQMDFARALAQADLLPDSYKEKPANVLLAVKYGEMQQVPTMAAILGVHIIKGRSVPSADLIQALVRRAGHRLRVWTEGTGPELTGKAELIRRDDPDFVWKAEWNLDRAEAAELTKKTRNGEESNWVKHPKAMLKRAVVREVAHDACPEVLLGLDVDRDDLYAPSSFDSDVDTSTDEDIADAEIVDTQTSAPQVPGDGQESGPAARVGEARTPAALRKLIWKHAQRLWPDLGGNDELLAEIEGEFAQMFGGTAYRNATPAELQAIEADFAARVPAVTQ